MFVKPSTPIDDFCKRRMLPQAITDAFKYFVRTEYRKETDALTESAHDRQLAQMDPVKIEEYWMKFVAQLRKDSPEVNSGSKSE